MDGDYVARLLMGGASSRLLDFGMDGGLFDTLCGGGGGGLGQFGGVGNGGDQLGAASREGSSVSDPAWASGYAGLDGANAKKRKAPVGGGGGTGKEEAAACFGLQIGEATGPASKRCKIEEGAMKPKVEETASDGSAGGGRGPKQGKGKSSKSKPAADEPPRDYVHVRARRGQATDSHSLAERVRREKITHKMKTLQDLVPGCNKVTGKAPMLDEIINYVQSLQQQVEFLSMKLATVNPQLDFSSVSALLHKDMYQSSGPSMSPVFPLESAGAVFPFCDPADLFQSLGSGPMDNQCLMGLLDTSLPHTANTQYAFQKQQTELWEEDLQNALHLDNEQSQGNGVSAPNFNGQLQAADRTIKF